MSEDGIEHQLPIGDLERLRSTHYEEFRRWYDRIGRPATNRYEATKAATLFGIKLGYQASLIGREQASLESMRNGIAIGQSTRPRSLTLRLTSRGVFSPSDLKRIVDVSDSFTDVVIDYTQEREQHEVG